MSSINAFKAVFFALASLSSLALAQDQAQTKDLSSLGLEQLMNVKVTTASKQAQSLSNVPAAVYVITESRIRRSGATNIPELLRMVPGVQVAQISPSQWSIGIRGMGGRFANKLLVLMDGRTVYSPTFSGVYWDAQDIDVSLIERIEVIRGPGGTLWGTNAVNGIINIITKAADKSKGDKVSLESSSNDPYRVSMVHGADMRNGAYRVDAQASRANSFDTIAGTNGGNAWDDLNGGFRTDWTDHGSAFSLNGRADTTHQGEQNRYPVLGLPYAQIAYARYTTSEYNMIAKWEKLTGNGKGDMLQISFDHYDRDLPEASDRRTTSALDYQHPMTLSATNHMVTGVGYQVSQGTDYSNPYISLTPETVTNQLYSAFAYDEQDLGPLTKLNLGAKLEHNDFTGWEIQPSLRLTYVPAKNQTYWGAISRAVRTPAIAETDTSIFLSAMPGPGGVPVKILLAGNPDFSSEVLVADELGWRFSPSDRTYFDVATFYNQYSGLRGETLLGQTLETSPYTYVLQTYQEANDWSATTAGVELAAHYSVTPNWRLDGSYAFYTESYNTAVASANQLGATAAGKGNAPMHQATLQSQLDLPNHMEFDSTVYYVGSVPGETTAVPAYARLDVRLGWHANKSTDFSLGVTNLSNTTHLEGYDTLFEESSLIRRSGYARIDFHF